MPESGKVFSRHQVQYPAGSSINLDVVLFRASQVTRFENDTIPGKDT